MTFSEIKLLIIGLGVGVLSGLLGVGGGIFLVPIMVGWFAIPQHNAHATSLLVVFPTAIVGSFIYGQHQQLDFLMAGSLTVGAMTGAVVGAHFLKRIPAAQLKRLFGLMLFLAGLRMVW